jgi:hypothetical protein
MPRPALEHPGSEVIPSPLYGSSARRRPWDSDLDPQPAAAAVTLIDPEPPLRAVGPLPASLLN